MDLDEIKQLIEEEGGKIIIVENNKPVLVVLSYAEYREKRRNQKTQPVSSPERSTPSEPQQKQSNQPMGQSNQAELTIDDLPL